MGGLVGAVGDRAGKGVAYRGKWAALPGVRSGLPPTSPRVIVSLLSSNRGLLRDAGSISTSSRASLRASRSLPPPARSLCATDCSRLAFCGCAAPNGSGATRFAGRGDGAFDADADPTADTAAAAVAAPVAAPEDEAVPAAPALTPHPAVGAAGVAAAAGGGVLRHRQRSLSILCVFLSPSS